MGLGWSRRRDEWHQPPPYRPLLLPPSSASSSASDPVPPPSSNPPIPSFSPTPPQPPGYVLPAGPSYSQNLRAPYPAAVPYPAPAPPPGHGYCSYPQYPPGGYANPPRMLPGRSNYQYYGPGQGPPWWPPVPLQHPPSALSASVSVMSQPPPYVERQQAVTVKNNVNLRKDTIRLEQDEQNPDQYLVCFTFDSLVDGSITIFYFAKEGDNCSFVPLYPEIHMPVSVPFQKGLGQKFCQPSGSGIDLGFFALDDLSKPSGEDVFPLIVSAEAFPEPKQTGDGPSKPQASGAQITQAVIEKRSDGQFQVKVIKQILWVDGERYELKEIFGLADSANAEGSSNDSGEECVICMTEPKNTAVLPCRHMCMCSECAKALRLQSNKCPICRQPVEELMEINVNGTTAS
ncbi:hypothetical protein Taro_006178 [Colocasia esculenta]|uniref:RING-type E3 ubiquitin transferase n=1 Tax=Colocasia esculenta TaxID=4460 RepID=A0A843TWT3_COLES|nr:hypothetical protein [Colocasia esculenta]